MGRGINKVILVGNCGADPDAKFTQSGSAMTNLSIATSESWKDKQSGERQERTEWHRVVAFNRLAEICGEYLKKGSKVYIEGQLRTRKWQDQQGQDRYTTEIVVREMQMLDNRAGHSAGGQTQEIYQASQQGGAIPTYHQQPDTSNAQREHYNRAPQQTQLTPPQQQAAPFDDDIPF